MKLARKQLAHCCLRRQKGEKNKSFSVISELPPLSAQWFVARDIVAFIPLRSIGGLGLGVDGADAAGPQGSEIPLEIPAQCLPRRIHFQRLWHVMAHYFNRIGHGSLILCRRAGRHGSIRRVLLHP